MDAGTERRRHSTGPPIQLRGLVEYTHWIYGLHSLSVITALFTAHAVALRFAFGLPSIIAVIMNYARRSETHGTWLEIALPLADPHFLVRLAVDLGQPDHRMPLILLGSASWLASSGMGLVGLWVIYRIVRGWLALRDGRAMPLPPPTP